MHINECYIIFNFCTLIENKELHRGTFLFHFGFRVASQTSVFCSWVPSLTTQNGSLLPDNRQDKITTLCIIKLMFTGYPTPQKQTTYSTIEKKQTIRVTGFKVSCFDDGDNQFSNASLYALPLPFSVSLLHLLLLLQVVDVCLCDQCHPLVPVAVSMTTVLRDTPHVCYSSHALQFKTKTLFIRRITERMSG